MERLSEQLKEDIYELVSAMSEVQEERLNRAINRLASYENTGLTPEEIVADTPDITEIEAKLDRYQQAEADGRLVMLPCKVGTTVYRVEYVTNTATGRPFYLIGVKETKFHLWDLENFGRTVFLTREEAETALAKLEEVS